MIRHFALAVTGMFCIVGSAQAHSTLEQAEGGLTEILWQGGSLCRRRI
ncbi:hypothetical protein J2X71_007465 [Rhizobium sp. 1399]|jgi:hypothetical protein|nr:hypothetical protein [Rhizobium sp. 1399]